MTTPIHDVPQSFISRTLFANPHVQSLPDIFNIATGTDFFHFNGRYERSQKQPDVFVRIDGFYWPTLIVETGWSEDHSDLVEDAKLWLLGSRDGLADGANNFQEPVNAVILIFFDHNNFEANKSTLTGYFQVWRCDPDDMNAIKQYLSIVSDPDSCHIRAASDLSS